MENMESEKKSVEEQRFYTMEDKCFWAAFLNLARHNVLLTVNHIRTRLGMKPFENDDAMSGFKTMFSEEVYEKDLRKKGLLLDLLNKHFPFAVAVSYGEQLCKKDKCKSGKMQKGFHEQTEAMSFENIAKVVDSFVRVLQVLRNHYSHFQKSETLQRRVLVIEKIEEVEKYFIKRLYNVFDTAVRMVKEDYKTNPDISIENFQHLIRKGKNGQKKKFLYVFTKENKDISEYGLLFFTSLFLDKRDAIWMQKKIKGLKGGRYKSEQMTNEVFCRSRMLIPKQRMESVYNTDLLMLDILNEVVRCPKHLFERLQEKDRDQFRIPLDQISEEKVDETNDASPCTCLIRHQNRFPYFALRFFDLQEVFQSLRFQVDLGTYHFQVYDKKIGESNEKCHLTRSLYGFARLDEFSESKQPKVWKNMVKDLDYNESSDLPFITKTTPHYYFSNNKIGLKFVEKKDEKWPSLDVEKSGRGKYIRGKEFVADAFLSVHELLPMMFYYLLVGSGEKVQNIIRKYIADVFSVYEKFANGEIDNMKDLEGENILKSGLPKQMIDILNGKKRDMVTAANRKIEELLDDTKKRIDQLEKRIRREAKIGKRNARLLKSGDIADWLVRDMMRFQPVAHDSEGKPMNRSKANSTEYRLLQRALALFGSEKGRLKRYLVSLHLVDSENPHPFLRLSFSKGKDIVEDSPNLLSFYLSYLKRRQSFLEGLEAEDWEKHQYFLLLKEPKLDRRSLVEGWKNGFNLPRGLFTEFIKEELKKRGIVEDGDIKRPGFVARHIPEYFSKQEKDTPQKFYQCSFNVGNPLKPERKSFPTEEKRKQEWAECKERFKDVSVVDQQDASCEEFRSWAKFEKELRMFKNQDILLWMMFRQLFEDKKKVEGLNLDNLLLKDVGPKEGDRLNPLGRILPMQVSVKMYETDEQGRRKNSSTSSLPTFYIEEKETRLLRQGNFKALVGDRRLNSLLSFVESENVDLSENPISKKVIEYELQKYQTERVKIFKHMLEIEEKLRCTPEIEKRLLIKYPDKKHYKFSEIVEQLEKEGTDMEKVKKRLINVRNAFSHNQYPKYSPELFGFVEKFVINGKKEQMGIAESLCAQVEKDKEYIY